MWSGDESGVRDVLMCDVMCYEFQDNARLWLVKKQKKRKTFSFTDKSEELEGVSHSKRGGNRGTSKDEHHAFQSW